MTATPASPLSSFLRRHRPYLFVGLAPLILFAPFLLGLRVLYWGTPLLQFYPWRKFAIDTLLSGHWPLWDPYLGNGAPLIANLQSAIFYPPNWLSLILPLDYSFGWLVALHLVWAGAGMVALARALGLKPLGQAVAGLAFGLSQYMVARAWFFSINATVAWVPWVIWAGELCLQCLAFGSPRARRYAWLLTLFLAMQFLAGHAQSAWYSLLLLAAWVGWRWFTVYARLGARLPAVALHFLPAIVGAAGLAALQLFPTAELLRQSPRSASAAYDFVMLYSFSPWRLLSLLVPDVLGNPARGQFYGYGNYWEDAIYVGMLPLLWALAAIVRAVAARRRPANEAPGAPVTRYLVPLLVLIAGVIVPLALGRNTPIFPFFYRYIPTFNLFQAPARMMLWLEFAVALLAGLGASQRQPVSERARWWLNISAAGSVSAIVTGIGVLVTVPVTSDLGPQYHTLARAVAVLGASLLISIILLLWQPPETAPQTGERRRASFLHPSPRVWELCVALFVAADLIFAGAGLNPGGPVDLYHVPTASGPVVRQALDGHRLFQYPGDEQQVFGSLMSFKTFGAPQDAYTMRESQLTDATLFEGISAVNNYDPLVSLRYEAFLAVISTTQSLNLLHLTDASIVASSAPLSWERVTSGGPTGFYRVPGQARRVRVVYSALRVPNEASALTALEAPNFDPETTVILEADNSAPLEPFPPFPWNASPPVGETLLSASPNAYTFTVSLAQTGWVVVSDTCYPGWAAWVDGKPAALRCGDLAFRAVLAGPGEHVIEFRYQPRSWAWGLCVSGLSWLLWLGLGAVWWFGRRARRNKRREIRSSAVDG